MSRPKRFDPVIHGSVMITDDINLIYAIPDNTIKILSLDEEGKLNPQLPNVIQSICLLPPVEALIAESDGDEDLYDIAYYQHLNTPLCQQFMGAVIAYLYKGGSFMVYAPQLRDSIAILKLRKLLWTLYGIGFGIIQTNTVFELDYRCIPIWLNLMYDSNVISPYAYLMLFPLDAKIDPIHLQRLVVELAPFAGSINEAMDHIEDLRTKIQENNTKPVRMGIHSLPEGAVIH